MLIKQYAAKSLQLCPTLCDPIDGSSLGSSVPGILQARILEWVAISFSKAWKWKVKVKSLSRVWHFTTPWTAAYQAQIAIIKNAPNLTTWNAAHWFHDLWKWLIFSLHDKLNWISMFGLSECWWVQDVPLNPLKKKFFASLTSIHHCKKYSSDCGKF